MKQCWQIRQELPRNGGEWRTVCHECGAQAAGVSCWELDTPCCCAPVHVTCDFCKLYIAHRSEIASMTALSKPQSQALAESIAFNGATRTPNQEGGLDSHMDKLQLNVPDMYADHHVLKVRAVLTGLGTGVQHVIASSAFRMVALEHDPAVVPVEAIEAALAKAGYPVSAGPGALNPVVTDAPVSISRGDPAWERLGVRISRTDARDAKSGRS